MFSTHRMLWTHQPYNHKVYLTCFYNRFIHFMVALKFNSSNMYCNHVFQTKMWPIRLVCSFELVWKICIFEPMLILHSYRKQYKFFAFASKDSKTIYRLIAYIVFLKKRTYLDLCKYRLLQLWQVRILYIFVLLAEIWTMTLIDFLKFALSFQVTYCNMSINIRCGLMHADLRTKYMCNRRKSGQHFIIFDHLFSRLTIFFLPPS